MKCWYHPKTTPTQTSKQFSATFSNNNFVFGRGRGFRTTLKIWSLNFGANLAFPTQFQRFCCKSRPLNLVAFETQNAKSQRFSYAISQLAPLPLVVALNRRLKSQIAARYAAFWRAAPQIALTLFPLAPLNRSVLNRTVFEMQAQLNRKRLRFINRSVLVPLSSKSLRFEIASRLDLKSRHLTRKR